MPPLEGGRLPGKRLGSGPVRECKESVAAKLVLFGASDLESAVHHRRAKKVPRVRVGRVEIRARVDHERLAATGKLERQLVVVRVAAESGHARVATADRRVKVSRADHVVTARGVR